MPSSLNILVPDWPAPASVKSAVSLRTGGKSPTPYKSLNLAEHVGDAPESVAINRQRLGNKLGISNICWMKQVHGTELVYADSNNTFTTPTADACWTDKHGQACAALTADCLPLLICDRQGSKVAALHAGWRGLANGIISKSLKRMNIEPGDVLVWLGPAIGPNAYQVGEDVRRAIEESTFFGQMDIDTAFVPDKPGHYLCNLYQLARLELANLGVSNVYGGDQCTYMQSEYYFSYRRDGQTGRMASLIWLA